MVIKMRKINKILTVFVIIILLTSVCFNVFAAIDPDDYEPTDPTVTESSEMTKRVGVILGIVRNISAVVAVISMMILGIKYMFASVEDRANYKTTMMPYIIGCVMAVSGTAIVSFIYAAMH